MPGSTASAPPQEIRICIGDLASPAEEKIAGILAERLSEKHGFPVKVERESRAVSGTDRPFLVLLGTPEHHRQISTLFSTAGIRPLSDYDPGPEGFLLKRMETGKGPLLLAAGVDTRGVLYAAGEILRQAERRDNSAVWPDSLEIRTAPAFELRGTQIGQSGVAREKAKVRPWTEKEMQRAILDYALAGLNTLQVGETNLKENDPLYTFLKSFGIKTLLAYTPNSGAGPPAWQASESIGRSGYLCPSIPEARKALLKKCEETFRSLAHVDYVRLVGGDGGGCECDRCRPYGKTFILLCEEMAEIIHASHPHAQIFISNQKFDNAGDLAIFRYLQEKPRPWLRAICYGPGSDAMSWQPGHRQTHRMDLFRYPGFGPFDRYLKEILHQLPPEQDIVFYNELTHWRYSQYGYIQMYPRADTDGNQPPWWNHFIYERRPDAFLTMVYDRLTFFAWPRYYYWVFQQTLRYGIGDCTHSSGTQDHFNQWMWQRLLWAPQRSLPSVTEEYARTWFGKASASEMAEAIFQLESNLEEKPGEPLPAKEGIDIFYRLVKQAGNRMSPPERERNWLWQEFMQKAALDKYIQCQVRRQIDLQQRIEGVVRDAFKSQGQEGKLSLARKWLQSPWEETQEMQTLRGEAEYWGEASNRWNGVRSEGLYNLKHDYVGLGWLDRQLQRASAASGEERKELLQAIVDYENPGEGGFYDNCGTFNRAPHLIHGYPYDHGQPYVAPMLSEGNRPSQRSMHFTQDEEEGVVFRYTGLDPNASYRVRFTLVRPWYQERYLSRMNQKSQSIYADDRLLAKDLELPLQMSDFFTFDIPGEVTRDGRLTLRLQKSANVAAGSRMDREVWRNTGGWGTIVSEVWLMKK